MTWIGDNPPTVGENTLSHSPSAEQGNKGPNPSPVAPGTALRLLPGLSSLENEHHFTLWFIRHSGIWLKVGVEDFGGVFRDSVIFNGSMISRRCPLAPSASSPHGEG